MPHHFSRAGVVHWGWPDGKNDVVLVDGAVVDEGLVLSHAVVEWDIVFLLPATEWVKQKNWVLESNLHELVTGVVQEEDVAIVEGVAHLEAVHSVSISLLHLLVDLSWSKSVFVEAIVESDSSAEVGLLS